MKTSRIVMYNGKAGTLYKLTGEYDSSLGVFLDGDTGLRPVRFNEEEKTYENCTQASLNGIKGYWHYDNEYFANALLRLVGAQEGQIVGVNGCKTSKFEIFE